MLIYGVWKFGFWKYGFGKYSFWKLSFDKYGFEKYEFVQWINCSAVIKIKMIAKMMTITRLLTVISHPHLKCTCVYIRL